MLLAIGIRAAIVMLFLMVLIILAQVFFRYVLNDALPWSEEAAKFLMLWMTGLIAPTAYRLGGFVSIDMVVRALPRMMGGIILLVLLFLAGLVLTTGFSLGWNHVNSGWLFYSSSLKIPLDAFEMKPFKLKLAWMYMSLLVGVGLLILVNVELILRSIVALAGREDDLEEIAGEDVVGAE